MSEPDESTPERRLNITVPVRLSTIDPERDMETGRPFFRSSEETSANVSRGGLFVRTAEPVTPGRRVLVEMEIAEDRSVQAVGRVVWSRRPLGQEHEAESGVGIQFLTAPAQQRHLLEQFLAEHTPKRKRARKDAPQVPAVNVQA